MRKTIIQFSILIVSIAIIASIAILFFPAVKVSGRGMDPYIKDGYKVVVSKTAYKKTSPKRGDVVCLRRSGAYAAFRVIGMPGDRVEFHNGDLFINGTYVKEGYAEGLSLASKAFEVPEGKYFMLGDNREVAEDSRFWSEPYVSGADIIGKIIYTISIKDRVFHSIEGTTLVIRQEGEGLKPAEAVEVDESITESITE